MLLSRYVSELIVKGEIKGLKDAMEQSDLSGMQTFDQALFQLYRDGKISLKEALANADSKNDLSLRIRLESAGAEDDSAIKPDSAIIAFMRDDHGAV
jgi:twitching motility protein PilU